jgi:hypothetical protein
MADQAVPVDLPLRRISIKLLRIAFSLNVPV